MKCIFYIFFVAVVLEVAFCKINFSDAYEKEMKKIVEECQADPATRASDEWIESEDLETADQEGDHILCRLTKIGSLNENGDVDKKGMEKDLKKGIEDEQVVQKIIEKCGTRPQGSTAAKSAIENFKCVKTTYHSLSN